MALPHFSGVMCAPIIASYHQREEAHCLQSGGIVGCILKTWRPEFGGRSAQLNISSHAYDVTLTSLARILTDCWLNGSDMHFAMLIFMLSLVISEEGRVLVRAIKGHSCGRARMARTSRLAKYLLRNISLFLVYNTSTLKLKLQKSDYPNHYMIKQNRSWCRP